MESDRPTLDFADEAFQQNPYPALSTLREHAPIVRFEPTGQWLVTRHGEVHAALRDRRMGRSYEHRYAHEVFGRPEPDARWAEFAAHERWSLLQLEPPDHTRIRSLIARAFTPGSVAALRPFMERTAGRLLTELAPEFDLVSEYAQPYSIAVICELLGVPTNRAPQLLEWSHAIVKMYELSTPDDQKAAANDAAREFMSYAYELLATKRHSPDTGLLSRLASVEEAGSTLSDDEIVCTLIVLLNAGHEATVNTLGNGVRALMLHREQWNRLRNGEVATASAVEELIRWDPPLQLFERWVLDEGVVIAGQALPVGAEIAMLFGAANRDPRRFSDPDRFDVGRGDGTHVGFGGGIHFCVGAPLARLELDIALAALVRARPELEIRAEPRFNPTFVIHGLTRLLVS